MKKHRGRIVGVFDKHNRRRAEEHRGSWRADGKRCQIIKRVVRAAWDAATVYVVVIYEE